MTVAPANHQSKHLFGKPVDNEQVFVMKYSYSERTFDCSGTVSGSWERTGPDAVDGTESSTVGAARTDRVQTDRVQTDLFETAVTPNARPSDEEGRTMNAEVVLPVPEFDGAGEWSRPNLELIPGGRKAARQRGRTTHVTTANPSLRRPVRRVSPEVRRRRTLLVLLGLGLAALAIPLGGPSGASHTTGPAAAAIPAGVRAYTVQAGDSLWSIAERLDPAGDPRPLVSQMAAQIGSYQVYPGERITLP